MLPLSPSRRATLQALCSRIAPPSPPGVDLPAAVEARLAAGDPEVARQVAVLLTVFDHPATGALFSGRPRHFAALAPEAQDACLRAWEGSRLPFRRTVFQALRRLVLSTFYALPESYAGIGYLGPFHERTSLHPWEGALPGAPSDAEPVARGPEPAFPPALGTVTPALRAAAVRGGSLAGETRIRAGVCVVGSGAGGAVAAARLAEAGHDVVVLEEGGLWAADELSEREAEMVPRLYADAGGRATDDLSVSLVQGRAVGGSTAINWLIMLRTPEWVLDEWAREHGTQGMRAADLAPVFARVEAETHTRPVPDDAHNPSNRVILEGAARLGWSARPALINARGCVRSGMCGLGCRYDARQGAAVAYLPRALAAGARLYADVRVDQVELAERGGPAPLKRVHGTALDPVTGSPVGRVTVEAPVVVLAGGAVGTPALLQRSGMGGGGVGKWLRLHPTTVVSGTFAGTMYQPGGIPISAVCDEFARGGGDGYGFWIECPPLYPAISAAALPGFGARHRVAMEALPRLCSMIVLTRDGADRDRSGGDVRVDRRGRTRIRYRLSAADGRTVLRGMEAAARIQLAAGAEDVATLHADECRIRSAAELGEIARRGFAPNRLGLLSAHVNGTCRIGRDPETSGCSPAGERWGVPGLYVCDGSLLPTAPGVNPQETIMALASVVAEGIHARHGTG
jgi:choline dehydrogenase-like flavoprotein